VACLEILLRLHLVVGLAFLLASAALAVWAFARHRRRQPLPAAYWPALRAAAALLGVQIVLGVTFVALHLRPAQNLHFLYAGLVTLGVAAQEMLRPTASLGKMLREEGGFNEAGTYAVLTGAVALLTLRLWMTGLGV
jgi:heme A synthase